MTRQYLRFTAAQRITHGLLMVSFLGLVATGMPLLFAHAGWARAMARAMGGFDSMGVLHRALGIVMVSVFLFHVAGLLHRLFVRKETGLLWGPDSLVPQPHDARQMLAHIKWFVGTGPQPKFDRYTYWEKFDYFAVFWGMVIIGGSGFVLWFHQFFSRFLPGWIFNIALLVHGEEALLAAGFIFTIHFFNSHLRPEKFPMDVVIFTGRVSEEELAHERPLEHRGAHRPARAAVAGTFRPRDRDAGRPGRRRVVRADPDRGARGVAPAGPRFRGPPDAYRRTTEPSGSVRWSKRSIHSVQRRHYLSCMKTTGHRPSGTEPGRQLLTTSEVSEMLGVSANTVTRWARQGRLPCRLTLGGHHRFERRTIESLQHDLTREARADGASRGDGDPQDAGKGGKLMKALVGGLAVIGLLVLGPVTWAGPSRSDTPAAERVDVNDCRTCHEAAVTGLGHTAHAGVEQSCTACHDGAAEHMKAQMEGTGGAGPAMRDMKASAVSAKCMTCHDGGHQATFDGSVHDRRGVSCISCHSVHAFKSAQGQLRTEKDAETCFTCHQNIRAKTLRSSHHPVREGLMTCGSCHDPHDGTKPKMVSAEYVNDKCLECHTEKRGPFLWEHAPVRESCLNCHDAHGSNHDKLLVAQQPFLCQRCHLNTRHPGTLYDGLNSRATSVAAISNRAAEHSCKNCHQSVHGSNHPSGPYLGR